MAFTEFTEARVVVHTKLTVRFNREMNPGKAGRMVYACVCSS